MQITNISEAKANLSLLIKKMQETNKPVIIGRAGKPVAILSPFKKSVLPRRLGGSWEGRVKISDSFNEPDKDISNSFYDSSLFPEES